MDYVEAAQNACRLLRRQRVRLVRVTDPADLVELVAASSPDSRYLRFHTGMAQLRPAMAAQLADSSDGCALGLRTRRGKLIAHASYTHTAPGEAEVAVLVADRYQGRGLGRALLAVLFEHAVAEGITALTADILASNDAILGLLASLAPTEVTGSMEGTKQVRITLGEVAAAA